MKHIENAEFEAPNPAEYTTGIIGLRRDLPIWTYREEDEPDEPDCD